MPPINASVSGQPQIQASVGETQVDVSVSGGFGPSGLQGPAASIAVGTVTTGAPGSSASVVNAGTSSAAVLNFVIPAGSAGATGATGPAGPAGTTTWAGITDKPSTFAPSAHTHTASQITDFTSAVIAAAPPTTNASLLTSGTLPDQRLSSNIARASDVTSAVAAVVNAAPASLDTLKELATALGDDANFASTVTNALAGKVSTSDARLTDSREWSAATVSQADAEAGTSTTRFAFTPARVFQAIAAWWAGSSAKAKLDGIQSNATANATDSQLRDRATHTGTQAVSTIDGLQTALDGKAAASHGHTGADITLSPSDDDPFSLTDPYAADFLLFVGSGNSNANASIRDSSKANCRSLISAAAATHTHNASDISTGTLSASRLPNTAVTAGSYGSGTAVATFTVDGTGRLTAAGTATITPAGIGAATASHTHTVAQISDFNSTLASPPSIGGTAPAAGSFTTLVASTSLAVPSGASGTPAAGHLYRSADTIRYRDSGNVERMLLNSADNLANLGNTATARTNLGLGSAATAATSDFAAASHSHAANAITSGTIATARLGSGSPSASNYLRGDGAWTAAPVTSVDGSTGAVTITKNAVYDFLTGSAPSGATGGSGLWTWSLPSWAKFVEIYSVGGGGGGGSGRRGDNSTLCGGGGGGAGGATTTTRCLVSDLSDTTLYISVGYGGGGAAAITANNTNGSAGTAGGQSSVRLTNSSGAIINFQDGYAGPGGAGSSTAGGGATGNFAVGWNVGNASQSGAGGDGTGTLASASIVTSNFASPTGGGGGGGVTTGGGTQAGAPSNTPYRGRATDGYANGANGGTAGNSGSNGGTAHAAWGRVGIGGGGGGSSATAAAGSGGNGGFPGGGGGGGGASRNGFNSGAGGNGADGLVRIIVWG